MSYLLLNETKKILRITFSFSLSFLRTTMYLQTQTLWVFKALRRKPCLALGRFDPLQVMLVLPEEEDVLCPQVLKLNHMATLCKVVINSGVSITHPGP